jgi:nucleolar protein 12
MEEQKLKFAKRKLRVERCKTVPGGAPAPRGPVRPAARSSGPAPADTSRPRAARPPATPITIPKGDPLLGKRLAGLSKEDRKAAKASDAERVARRSAKKKAKTALVKDAPRLDDRVRVRKRPGGRKGVGSAGKETKKRAVNLAKRNLKK